LIHSGYSVAVTASFQQVNLLSGELESVWLIISHEEAKEAIYRSQKSSWGPLSDFSEFELQCRNRFGPELFSSEPGLWLLLTKIVAVAGCLSSGGFARKGTSFLFTRILLSSLDHLLQNALSDSSSSFFRTL